MINPIEVVNKLSNWRNEQCRHFNFTIEYFKLIFLESVDESFVIYISRFLWPESSPWNLEDENSSEAEQASDPYIAPIPTPPIPISTKASIRSDGRYGLGKVTEEMRVETKRKNLARDGYTESTCCCVQAIFLGIQTKISTFSHLSSNHTGQETDQAQHSGLRPHWPLGRSLIKLPTTLYNRLATPSFPCPLKSWEPIFRARWEYGLCTVHCTV